MKILLVIDRLTNPHAGTEGQFLLLIHLLQKAGCELRVLILANSEWLNANPLPCTTVIIGSSSIKSPEPGGELMRRRDKPRLMDFN
ncbi:hypothetical protein [Cellvibrio sp. PSBB023]|uniref:hypothetical protein n=1 Tax=Cellvibrio sp. PSBB023 TaxID=1945512 RepID=UPI00098EF848|nr:hypothetical protein [Cellvibrio sp. PSBB023]AQT61419.1 hypothetical protein B0D95_15875 [Cellvibrio sp. PSBB023]